jgi:hypothetical protein
VLLLVVLEVGQELLDTVLPDVEHDTRVVTPRLDVSDDIRHLRGPVLSEDGPGLVLHIHATGRLTVEGHL